MKRGRECAESEESIDVERVEKCRDYRCEGSRDVKRVEM